MRRVLTLLILGLAVALPAVSAPHGKLVIITIGGASLDDVTSPGLRNISRLIEQGAIGVMNARPANAKGSEDDTKVGKYSMEGGSATIGAGTRAAVTEDARNAYSVFERSIDDRPVPELYRSLYGKSPGSAEVVHLGINSLSSANSEARYPIEIGAVGSALHHAGFKTAAIGNGDRPSEIRREASLIPADSDGLIDYGDVSSRMIARDPRAPYGIRTDAGRVLSEFRRVVREADLIVIDDGDTARAASYATHCLAPQARLHVRRAMLGVDRIVGGIVKDVDLSRDRVIIVSPNPSAFSIQNYDFLRPVVASGAGLGHGLLTSGSTRRIGIITNTDLSASIVDFFGAKAPYSFVGRPMSTVPGPVASLVETNRRIVLQIERQPAMRGLAGVLTAILILLSLYILLWPEPAKWAGWAALTPVAALLAVLWLPAIASLGIIGTSFALIGLTLFLILIGRFAIGTPGRAFGWICGALVATALIDLARGAVLLRDSIMSYTPVDGARYYGIGNEHMGSVIGALFVGGGLLMSAMSGRSRRFRMPLVAALLLIVALAIGLPSYGAKAGGSLATVAAAMTGLMLWSGRKIRPKQVALAAAITLGALGLMLVIDLHRSSGAQSHIAKAAQLIASGGPKEILDIIGRKAAMNLMLLRFSVWSKMLFAAGISSIVVLCSSRLDTPVRLRANKEAHAGIIAATVGAAVSLLFNDAGVIAAATASAFIWTAVILTAIPSHEKRGKGA